MCIVFNNISVSPDQGDPFSEGFFLVVPRTVFKNGFFVVGLLVTCFRDRMIGYWLLLQYVYSTNRFLPFSGERFL